MKKIVSVIILAAILLSTVSVLSVSAAVETILTTDKTTYIQGEPIIVNAKSENSSGKDWVGISVKGDETGAAIYWEYIADTPENFNIATASHKASGRPEYHDLPAGEYTLFIIPNDLTVKKGYSQALAMVDITILPQSGEQEKFATVSTSKSVYTVGEKILVTAESSNLSGKDWVGIIPKGATDGAAIYWAYLSAIEADFDISLGKPGKNMEAYYSLPAGEYTVFIIENDLTLKKGYATSPAMIDITIVEETVEPSPSTGDSAPVVFAVLALISLAGVSVMKKKSER